jgi:hypothetical protein
MRSAVCAHGYADCLLKNMSTKYNTYVVNKKLEHVDDISFGESFGNFRSVCYQINLSLPSTRYLYLRWPFFFMKHMYSNR